MQKREKALLSILPFVGNAVIVYALTAPAFTRDQLATIDLNSRKTQLDQLQAKLRQRTEAEAEKLGLETDMRTLRNAVPKSPQLDLLMIDLERMCNQSKVDLVAVERPPADTLRQLDKSEDEVNAIAQEQSGKLLLGSKTLQKQPVKKADENSAADDKESASLKKVITQVYITGSYPGLVQVMKKLESYQRIIGIKRMAVAISSQNTAADANPASERAQRMKLREPLLSFLMTLYYLP